MENVTLKLDPAPGLLADYVEKHGPSALAPFDIAGPLGALGVARGWGSGGEPSSAEAYFQDRDAFVRYVEEEVNPARAAEGLSTCDPRAAAHLYEVISSRRYRQPSGKTPNVKDEPRAQPARCVHRCQVRTPQT